MRMVNFEELKNELMAKSYLYIGVIAPSGVKGGKLFAKVYIEDNLRCEKDKMFFRNGLYIIYNVEKDTQSFPSLYFFYNFPSTGYIIFDDEDEMLSYYHLEVL